MRSAIEMTAPTTYRMGMAAPSSHAVAEPDETPRDGQKGCGESDVDEIHELAP
jgi:hypothetical protein